MFDETPEFKIGQGADGALHGNAWRAHMNANFRTNVRRAEESGAQHFLEIHTDEESELCGFTVHVELRGGMEVHFFFDLMKMLARRIFSKTEAEGKRRLSKFLRRNRQ
jgi:hypothetical protein